VLRRLFQFLLLVLSVQLGGLSDAIAYAAELSRDDQGCCSDCPTEKSGLGCPPGCRLCHCHQAGAARLPDVERQLSLLPNSETHESQDPSALSAPRSAPISGVYRPPRALTLRV
jgi:hypothetical protein